MGKTVDMRRTLWCFLLVAVMMLAVAVCMPRTVQAAQPAAFAAAEASETVPGEDEGEVTSEPEVISIPQQEAPLTQQATGSSTVGTGVTMVFIALCAMALGTLIFFVRRLLPHKEETEG